MKRNPVIVGCTLILVAAVGCVPTLNPLFTENDLVFKKELLGTWIPENNSKEVWAFEADGDTAYTLHHTDDDGVTAEFDAHLVHLDGTYFLDIYPSNADGLNQLLRMSVIPAHLILRIDTFQPLSIAMMNPSKTHDILKADPGETPHVVRDDLPILTGTPKELQAFIVKFKDTVFFDDAGILQRKTEGADADKPDSPTKTPDPEKDTEKGKEGHGIEKGQEGHG